MLKLLFSVFLQPWVVPFILLAPSFIYSCGCRLKSLDAILLNLWVPFLWRLSPKLDYAVPITLHLDYYVSKLYFLFKKHTWTTHPYPILCFMITHAYLRIICPNDWFLPNCCSPRVLFPCVFINYMVDQTNSQNTQMESLVMESCAMLKHTFVFKTNKASSLIRTFALWFFTFKFIPGTFHVITLSLFFFNSRLCIIVKNFTKVETNKKGRSIRDLRGKQFSP